MTVSSLTLRLLGKDESAGKTFDKLGSKASGVGKKLALAFSGAAILKFGKDSVTAFGESEQAQTRLTAALAKNSKTTGVNASAFAKLNTELAKKSRFDDDATASGEAVLAQFHLTEGQIKTLVPLMQDYAAKTGKDLPTAAGVLGKALLGKGRALAEVGIRFKDTGTQAGNFEQIVGGLRQQVGGFAEQEGKTASGRFEIMKNKVGELEEKVGSRLVPALTKGADILGKVADFVTRNSDVILPLAAVVGTVVVGIKAWTIAQAALNLVMALNPVGLVVIAIAALVAGIVVAYNKSETFRNIVNGAFRGVQKVIGDVTAFVIRGFRDWLTVWLTVADGIVSGAATALGWVPGVGDKLKAANTAFDKFKKDTLRTLDDMADKAGGLGEKTAKKLKAGFAKVIGPNGLATYVNVLPNGRVFEQSTQQHRASGGPVRAGEAYTVGENGPETLVMGSHSGAIVPYGAREMGDRSNVTVIHVHGTVVDAEGLFRAVQQGALRHNRRSISNGLSPA